MPHRRQILPLQLTTVCLLLSACGGRSSDGQIVQPPPGPTGPPTVLTQQVFANVALSFPTAMAQAPGDDSRWFVPERSGRIIVFDNDLQNATGSVFLDITGRVDSSGEGGLLGIAFHPDFASNGEVFLSYTRTGSPLESFISRFRSFDNNQTLDPSMEEPLLTVTQRRGNHNGGDLAFGPDGFLYAGFGDEGGSGDPFANGQNSTSLHGTVIRIDVNTAQGYAIPPGNPFAQNAPCGLQGGFGGASCPEIYAWGFRNPWRFSFDSQTGDIWVGDVGQNDWEEIDRVDIGENYGWNVREGAHCFQPPSGCGTNFVDPITEYGHDVGGSVTGGYVYRGSAIPDLRGFYVFGDFISGRLWAVPADSPIGTAPIEIANTDHSIVSFGLGEDGALYLLDFGSDASIYQLIVE